ncbi:hypothetical protein Hanom_Chr09g00770551 [Helianthus anomalus]
MNCLKSKGFHMPKLGTKCVRKCKPRGPFMYFWKRWGLNTLQSANHGDHLCTFGKLGTKCRITGKPHGPSVYYTLNFKTI